MQSKLKNMTDSVFSEYLKTAIPNYAHDNIESGRWAEKGAIERSSKDHKRLLPQGTKTDNNYLFEIISKNRDCSVGILWVAVEENYGIKTAFIYDIEVKKAYRRKGYARSALIELERFANDLNIHNIGLHVFRQNRSAQALYNSLGYNVVSTNMVKSIA
ncbi:GNAT family N-acetyltransferase [Teredinibacter franksiae]|uniref:GNAT family N-acetyltransferase n=1 Tax=Teredinibacter franksiae TaxID=2761453 RepID=UPI00162AF097|nr:GNAT family N-acetyltransferase [Teredinibacter franksiae]